LGLDLGLLALYFWPKLVDYIKLRDWLKVLGTFAELGDFLVNQSGLTDLGREREVEHMVVIN